MLRAASITLAILVGAVLFTGYSFVDDNRADAQVAKKKADKKKRNNKAKNQFTQQNGGKKKKGNQKGKKGNKTVQLLARENAQLRQNVNQLIGLLKQRDQLIARLQTELRKKGKGGKGKKGDNKELLAKLQRQEDMIANLQTELNRLKKKTPSAKIPNPPAKKVKGKITKINADDKSILTLDIGSDDGLQSGHTLEVYRASTTPLFLGLMRVDTVTATTATGRLLRNDPASPLQPEVGNGVADIMPRE